MQEFDKIDRYLSSQEFQDELLESARMVGNPAQIDLLCSRCGKTPSKQEREELENPALDGKYPEFICGPCHKKEYETCVMEYEWQVQEEKWAHQKKKHEGAKPALREQDVEVLDDYRAAPRF